MQSAKSTLSGLVFKCPMEHETDQCIFRLVRQIPVKQRLEYLNNLSEKRQMELLMRHKECLAKRENGHVPFSEFYK